MKRQEAIQLIDSTFNKAFDEDRFTLFIKNFLNDIDTSKYNEYKGNLIKDAFKDHVSQYKRIGKYIDPNGEALDVLLVEVKDQSKLDRARTALRNFVISHLDSFEKDYALVAFYSKSDHGADWRFSYVKLEYRSEVKEGKIKQRKELTPAKRYSFLVGELEQSHTAKSQLLPLLQNVYNNPTLEQIEEAFSIESVTDEFFEQYKLLFSKLVEQFDRDKTLQEELSKNNIDTPRFAKKLLGQIVFLYFLQKKGWMGVPKSEVWGKGDKRFLQTLFDLAESKSQNFFAQYLQILFYDALAREHHDEGVKGYFAKLNSRIPFLNGGLFEADYDWQTANITIPNALFRNDEPLKSGDTGTGILDVFDRYNFTIKEDEPLEKEVAVDPEMLGKVFENMLEVTERKSKGAFYTPREIVHYMCQESLIHYLDNSVNDYNTVYQGLGNDQLSLLPNTKKGKPMLNIEHKDIKVPRADIEEFIRHGFFGLENDQRVIRTGKETSTYKFQLPESVRTHADLLDKHLSTIKICDPAIGSGAFPVGLLLELVNAQLVLRQYLSTGYFEKKLKSLDLTKADYEANENSYLYRLKRHTIQESIYGVDIDASAIDVARLRLWLSLVVDEEDLDNIEALPNLDYKIVCGNSLIGLPYTVMRDLKVQGELEELKEKFFGVTNDAEKKALRTTINQKIRQLLDSAEQFTGYEIDFDFKLFFSEVWRDKGGFDVFIGNPPYVRVQSLSHYIIDIYKSIFNFAWRRIDISILFFEKSFGLLNAKGLTSFISSNQFLTTEYGRSARKFFSRNGCIFRMIDFGSLPVFKSALTYVSIFFLNRVTNKHIQYSKIKKLPFYYPSNTIQIQYKNLGEETWLLADSTTMKINSAIGSGSTQLSTVAKSWAGIITGLDDLLLFDEKNLPDYIEHELLKPVIRAQNCSRYSYVHATKYAFYPYKSINGKTEIIPLEEMSIKFPKAYQFIIDNQDTLKGRKDSRRTMGEKKGWYGLIRFGTQKKFDEIKIVSPGEVKRNKFALDTSKSAFSCARVFSINVKQAAIDIKYLLPILNSSIVEFYLHNNSSLKAGGFYSYSSTVLDTIPIKVSNNYVSIIYLTDYLLFVNESNQHSLISTFLDNILDAIVFQLYFPSEMTSANKDILKYLSDLKPISESMSPEAKLAIIQSEFNRLYDPNHPVRNAVETLDSVEEVRIIREALRK